MTDSGKYGLSVEAISSLKLVFSHYLKIQKVILYGSRAKGGFKPGSDIDLVLVAPEMDLTQLMAIENKIEELLLPYKIDLCLFHQIENYALMDHIKRVGVEF